MDLLEGITKKARCYRAYILTNTMQEEEERRGGERRGKVPEEEVDQTWAEET